jgi:acyl carrier protein phosphodiesterase
VNYLVHLYLAGDDPGLQIGSIMGDFVKGPIPAHYSAQIRSGLRHHRQVDAFSQTNQHCRNSRRRLHARFGHVRSVMVDMFYDHFLADSWPDYHAVPLEEYAARFYRTLRDYDQWLPEELARIAPRMTERNWLVAYREKATVERALQHLACRLSRATPLGEGLVELSHHETALRQDFAGFMLEAGGLKTEP